MSYAQLHDSFTYNKKVLAIGNAAAGAFCRLLAWSAGNKTNGELRQEVINTVCSDEERTQLSAVGLISHVPGIGWVITDYLEYNPSGEKVAELKRQRAIAGRKGGEARVQAIAQANAQAIAQATAVSISIESEASENTETKAPTSEQRYAHAYAEGMVQAAPGTTYPDPFDQTQLGELNRFTIQAGWGKGLRGEALLEAIRAVSKAYRKAMANDAFHGNAGYPPKLCMRWAAGSGWKPPRRPVAATLGQVDPMSPSLKPDAPKGQPGPSMTPSEYAAEMQKLAESLDEVKS